jgi:hypothetical protein
MHPLFPVRSVSGVATNVDIAVAVDGTASVAIFAELGTVVDAPVAVDATSSVAILANALGMVDAPTVVDATSVVAIAANAVTAINVAVEVDAVSNLVFEVHPVTGVNIAVLVHGASSFTVLPDTVLGGLGDDCFDGQGYRLTEIDQRTFGAMQQRLLDDLNRPDLGNVVQSYIRDAIRYFSRKSFFFSECTNENTVPWEPNTIWPRGSTITFSSGFDTYIAVASNTGMSGTTLPSFTTTPFVPPSGSNQSPPPPGGVGTTDDGGGPPNGIRWLTVENASALGHNNNYWTQLSTVYSINKYRPPIDYNTPRLVEVTAASLRYRLIQIPYDELRAMDVIRPSPITVYPTYWAWFSEHIYVWPYPNGFYPLTLSFYSAPPVPKNADFINFWTTDAEALIRAYAEYLIQTKVLKDAEAAALAKQIAMEEFAALQSQASGQNMLYGIPPSDDWSY